MRQGLIRIGIIGYGNIGKGVEKAIVAARDIEIRAIFTRRDPSLLTSTHSMAPILPISEAEKMVGEIDVMALCGSSSADLATQGPHFAALFNTVDCFDTHAKIPEYLAAVDEAAKNTAAIVASGWDPGLFSMVRALSESVLPDGASYTFWGRGVSQGHSEVIRQIEGVKDAVQYTVPLESALIAARSGTRPTLVSRQRHLRECYVVANPGADKDAIELKIKSFPDYFADYDTSVTFIDHDEFVAKHSKMPHGGMVLRSGATGDNGQSIEFSLKLGSNPEFTGSVMAAYARAAFRLASEGIFGAKTVLDVPLSYISEKARNTLISELL